jgi:DNA polymerase III alpha subunit (gram-positive type)
VKILCLDVESTGLNPEKDQITEWGAALYDSDTKQPVRVSGFLIKGVFISEEITRITHITQSMVDTYGVSPEAGLSAIYGLAQQAEMLCGHNFPFDRSFLDAESKRQGKALITLPHIDTRTDLPPEAYKKGKSASLRYLAADHGFCYDAHRAVNDVLATLKLLSMYDLDTVIKRSQIPNVEVRAVVDYDDRLLAKERGYYWKSELKQWRRPMKLNEVDAEKQSAPFPVILCEEK